jgi:hypothetical protein
MNVWTAILLDPTVHIDRHTLHMVVRDQRQWTRRWLYPLAMLLCQVSVWLIRGLKLAVNFRAHNTMDRLCVWFLHRFVSPNAGALLIRHFQIETNLLNFLVRNSAVPGLEEVTLRPATLTELGNRAVIEHDLNVYEVLAGLGTSAPTSQLDYSMLTLTPIDAGTGVKRWLNLDIQTALCLMNIPFALCLTRAEYERAVHSLRLDESLLALLADLTGDETFLRWRPGTNVVRVDTSLNVPKAVYEHALACEFAHAHLLRLASGATRPHLARVA